MVDILTDAEAETQATESNLNIPDGKKADIFFKPRAGKWRFSGAIKTNELLEYAVFRVFKIRTGAGDDYLLCESDPAPGAEADEPGSGDHVTGISMIKTPPIKTLSGDILYVVFGEEKNDTIHAAQWLEMEYLGS